MDLRLTVVPSSIQQAKTLRPITLTIPIIPWRLQHPVVLREIKEEAHQLPIGGCPPILGILHQVKASKERRNQDRIVDWRMWLR